MRQIFSTKLVFLSALLSLPSLAAEQKLFTGQAPSQLSLTDGAKVNYELGMRFQSAKAGKIKAIRFYKSAKESGKHTGHIFSKSGQVLATISFAAESASGWQQQALVTPLSVAANTEYTVSVNTGNTYYVATNNAFGTQLTNGDLKAAVGSGVFGSVGSRPAQSWSNSNYFRDIIFEAGAATVPTPPVPTPPVPVPPPSVPSTGAAPLSFDDARYANTVKSGDMIAKEGVIYSNISIDQNTEGSSFGGGDFTLKNSRIRSNEGIRLWGSSGKGGVVIDGVYVEATGTPGDHADGLQCYSPGGTNTVQVSNTTFRAHNEDATAGFFVADAFGGDFSFNNVVFWGGPFGLRMHSDGRQMSLSMKDVYFVAPFMYAPMLIDSNMGSTIQIKQWDNVREATIVNGKLVPGNLIPKP